MKRKWGVLVMLLCLIVVMSVFFSLNKKVIQIPFYKQSDFKTVSNTDSWENFREKLKISKDFSKIENYQLIIDKNEKIYAVDFDVIDKVNGNFEVYHYRNCFSCELPEENKAQITKTTGKEWIQYPKLINAHEFFEKLDSLKQENFFQNRESLFILITSSGWNEGVGINGDYFELANQSINKINKEKNTYYKGVNVKVMGNALPSNFGTNSDTDTVFISRFSKGNE